MCGGSVCPPNSFRCQSGICIDKENLCDENIDCFDGSDELPSICKIQEWTEMTPDESKDLERDKTDDASCWRVSGCRFIQRPGLRISDFFSEFSYGSMVQYVPHKTVVTIGCDPGYKALGNPIVVCGEGNEWSGPLDICMPVCNQTIAMRNPSYTAQCWGESMALKDCREKTLAEHTTMRLTCARGYESINGIDHADFVCNENGEWTGDTPQPACKPICGILSKCHPHIVPWTVSIFRFINFQFEFKCFGTIIASDVVITDDECFNDNNHPKDKYIYYSVVVGQHRTSFNLDEDHGYTVHTIAKLHPVTAYVLLTTIVSAFSE